jgi:hypothetical protein
MSALTDLVLGCVAIKGMDRFVLFGWAAQVEEGGDTAYASKVTVADFLGLNGSTVLRRTRRLVKAGVMVATGEVKFWEPGCETPVYRLDIRKIADLTDGVANCHGVANCQPWQNATQGSRSASMSGIEAGSGSSTTELRSVPADRSNSNSKPANRRTAKPKTCRHCGESLSRNKNHACKTDGGVAPKPPVEGLLVPPAPPSGDDVAAQVPSPPPAKHIEEDEFEQRHEVPEAASAPRIPCRGLERFGCKASMKPEYWEQIDGWCPACRFKRMRLHEITCPDPQLAASLGITCEEVRA